MSRKRFCVGLTQRKTAGWVFDVSISVPEKAQFRGWSTLRHVKGKVKWKTCRRQMRDANANAGGGPRLVCVERQSDVTDR